jgi:hypothetical protein
MGIPLRQHVIEHGHYLLDCVGSEQYVALPHRSQRCCLQRGLRAWSSIVDLRRLMSKGAKLLGADVDQHASPAHVFGVGAARVVENSPGTGAFIYCLASRGKIDIKIAAARPGADVQTP